MHNPEEKLGHREEDFNLTPRRMPQVDAEKTGSFRPRLVILALGKRVSGRSSTIQPSTSINAANFGGSKSSLDDHKRDLH